MIDDQSIHDLEFDQIRDALAQLAIGPTARERLHTLRPLRRREDALLDLERAHELQQIRDQDGGFPRIEFEELESEIQRLSVEGGVLDLEGFRRLLDASRLVNELLTYFQSRREQQPNLQAICEGAYITNDIIDPIEQVLDARMNVKDDASPELRRIRQEIRNTRKEINKNFDRVMRKLIREGVLGDTHEAYINERRVLTVVSNFKRTVAGNVVGASKSGGITYIEPRENMALNNELEMLIDDERAEIRRIFLALTRTIRRYTPLISAYQRVLTELDFIQAKVRFGQRMNACRPAISEDMEMELIQAYHPLLYLANLERRQQTMPQDLRMDKLCRMLVISGPNAGGKSITLKTVGLLQVMVQSGLLVPVDPSSRFAWFHHVLTDIGDNQSISDQLSTYSYRLKRMRHFLEVSNKRTLLLLDEFGTGSDPELGGALAEVFFETLYNRKSFAVITTHYANIKLKAARLRNAVNASMLFNRDSLAPMYQLSIGQPGSSFTFEVAQINGIDQALIEEAKQRVDRGKVELDQLISDLQREKSVVEEANRKTQAAEESARNAEAAFQQMAEHYRERLARQQEVIDRNNKELQAGRKMLQFIQSYKLKGSNKEVLEEVRKYLAIEKNKGERKKREAKSKASVAEPAPKKSKKPKKSAPAAPPKPVVVGATVRLKSHQGKQRGEVLEVSGKEAIVLFGLFKTKARLDDLEVV